MSDDASPPSRPPHQPHQPHDKLFKSAFSDLETAAAFLKTQLPARVAAGLDWSSLTIEEGSFIDGQLQGSACDLLYRVRRIGRQGAETDVFIYVLFEHQREEDYWLAWRLLVYRIRVWQRFLREHPKALKLPMVIPVVLAQNAQTWKVSTRFEDLVEVPPEWDEELLPMVPKFTCRLVQLAEMPFEQIEGTPWGVLVLRALKAERLGELLGSEVWDEALLSRLPMEGFELLLFYIYACGDFDNEAFANKVRAVSSPEIRTTAMTFAQRLHQEGRQEGHHEGRQEGRREGFREGRQEGQIQAGQQGILEVLEIRFQHVPPGLREEIEAIDDTARLSQLHRAAIRCADLEAFSREL